MPSATLPGSLPLTLTADPFEATIVVAPARPPLDLSVVITDPSGASTRWGSEDSQAQNIIRGLTHRTQRMTGFADGGGNLRRRIDRDYVDMGLLHDVKFVGAQGDIAYEGRVQSMARSFDTEHSFNVQLAGWMAHAADRTFTEVFVDRDLSAWRGASRARQVNLIAQTFRNTDPQVVPDASSALPAVLTEISDPNWVAGMIPCSEAWYDAGNALVSKVYYDWERGPDVNIVGQWQWVVATVAADDGSVASESTVNLKAATSTPGYFTPVTPVRFARLFFGHSTSPNAGSDGLKFGIYWKNIAVYGSHGLTVHGDNPGGVYASDVIKHLAGRYAPQLRTTGVRDTTYPIPHLVFKESTKPYDAFLACNAYHLWNLAVWENRTLHYGPTDLTDYDWEVRHDDPGVGVTLQGDSAEDLRNGIVVQFNNVQTGTTELLTPDAHPELRDDSVENPANQHGLTMWGDPFVLSIPTTTDAALQIGRAALAEFNQPKAPGTITVQGHIRDRAGHWQPVWRVRAGDRIRLTSSASLSDRPRMIQETSYDHDSRTVTIGVDSTMKRLDAVIDRISTALGAANLS